MRKEPRSSGVAIIYVVSPGRAGKAYFCGLWHTLTKDFDFNVTEICMKGDGHDSGSCLTIMLVVFEKSIPS